MTAELQILAAIIGGYISLCVFVGRMILRYFGVK
jgi:hypothetical protein